MDAPRSETLFRNGLCFRCSREEFPHNITAHSMRRQEVSRLSSSKYCGAVRISASPWVGTGAPHTAEFAVAPENKSLPASREIALGKQDLVRTARVNQLVGDLEVNMI